MDRRYDPDQSTTVCIWHTAVSGAHDPGPPFPAENTPNYGVDWTGYLDEDGTLYQYRGIEVNVDATDDANPFAIAFETWDGGDPESNQWTPWQISKMKIAMVELNGRLSIPYRTCPAWDAPGFGYHRLFPEWDKPFHYHSCPGDLRKQQWDDEIVPWLAEMANPPVPQPAPPEEKKKMVTDILAMYAYAYGDKHAPDHTGVSFWLGVYQTGGAQHCWDQFMGAVVANGGKLPA